MPGTDVPGTMVRMGFTVRRSTREDWQAMRRLRLEALQDTPMAFGQTYENALLMSEAEWRAYAGRGEERNRLFVVAVDEASDEFIGMMGGALDHGGGAPFLVAVFVSSTHRGARRGVSDALLEAIEDWARGFSDRLQLDVHEDNTRARRYYEARGFVETGHTMPYPLDRTRLELNMVKRL
ncbi:GNAT family N-acetyltransferase [Gryllotalpicola protaetiae]|uniref:GNAT family N-acetyltransferase n=1 Tax=Gryllotalpicola protaetiae TaxID=2419771 RepID=A0A387BH13_9MICO|nr:GNAT family N-acetyltransferase [Gryllotalpicola protaetiae]AYG03295.1 GNAT family N-acetyltransferase [Gryllotalpicola protaetiae]